MQSLSPELIGDQNTSFDLETDALLEEDEIPFEDEDSALEHLEDEEIPFDDKNNSGFADPTSASISHSSSNTNRRIRTLDFSRNSNLQPEIALQWPVYLWRVAAPIATDSEVNFLILACVRLAEAGVRTISNQAQYLSLSQDLVTNLLDKAQDDKYLDENYKITEQGKNLLASEGVENKANTQYGWILQEAVSGDILPFFYSGKLDKFIIPKRNETELFIPILFPIPEKPPESSLISQRVETYYKLVKDRQDSINTSEILTLNYWSSEENLEEVEFDSIGFPIDKDDLPINDAAHQVVRVLSKKPERYDLLVRVCIDETADGSFSILCPFGLPDAMRWMRLFYFVAKQDKGVNKLVEDFQCQSRKAWKQKQPSDLDPIELNRDAYKRLIYEMEKPLDKIYHSTWIELEKMMQSRILLERGFDEADSTITRAQKALEQLMLTLIKSETVSDEAIALYNAKGELSRYIRDTVTACGLMSVPSWLTRPSIEEIKKIIMKVPRRSLLAYISTFVFIAGRKGKAWQILKSVLRENPNFLYEMDKVANIRNELGAHAKGDRTLCNDYIATQAHELVDIACKNIYLLTKT